jgi:SulP family sulfate permease
MIARTHEASFAELYTPKLVTILRERYGLADLKADLVAGLTVAIVALPLSMAIAIASGVTPDRGLYTAIVGGFLVSALGGSRFQIGGPAGGLHRAGRRDRGAARRRRPRPRDHARRADASRDRPPPPRDLHQVHPLPGHGRVHRRDCGDHLRQPGEGAARPRPRQGAGAARAEARSACRGACHAQSGGGRDGRPLGRHHLAVRRFRPHWPAYLIAVGLAAVLGWLLGLPVETIGTRFGGIPHALPMPHLPALSIEAVGAVLPDALAFALLGGIESLLSAVVADSMTGRRHRSNCELVAQGSANIGSALFGGICVTGTIARTATNVRAGARGPVAGMLHSLFLLLFILVAAPLASYIPLAALAAVLAVVAWNMAEKHAFATLLRASRGDALVLLATFLLVVFRDLTEGILVGFGIGALLFLHRMAQAVEIESGRPAIEEDVPDTANGASREPYDAALATDRDVVVYRISGAFFFGAAASVAAALDRIGEHPKAYVIDFAAVPVVDSTAAATIEGFARKARRHRALVYLAGARPAVRRVLLTHGVRPPHVRFRPKLADAIAAARRGAARGEGARRQAGGSRLIRARPGGGRRQPRSRFAAALAFDMSSWPAWRSLRTAMTRPMSFATLAPVSAIAALTAASSSASPICFGRKPSMTAISSRSCCASSWRPPFS